VALNLTQVAHDLVQELYQVADAPRDLNDEDRRTNRRYGSDGRRLGGHPLAHQEDDEADGQCDHGNERPGE
jgi:hypothetical protein